MEKQTVQSIIRQAESNYKLGYVVLGEHVQWSLKDTINRIFAYLNSRHITGQKDSLNRDKPFFNIVTAAVNVWFKATDLDRKDIVIQPSKSSDTALAFVATVLLQDWMKKARFGVFLNSWGRTLSQYGSAVIKFVEQDGELKASVVPWNRLIVDPIRFDAIPVIEKFYMTPEELRKNKQYDQEFVDQLIEASQVGRKTLQGSKKDNQNTFVELYEVHGELPVALLKDDIETASEDEWDTYRQQMHVVTYLKGKNGQTKDFTLFKGIEAKNPYMITHLIEEEGRTLSIGAVEYLFDAQWMSNHTMKQWKDQLDLSSKLVFQTADANFLNRNVLTAIESGDILVHNLNMPLTEVPNGGHDITNLQSFSAEWKAAAQDITSTPDAMRGKSMGLSVTAARQTNLLQQAAANFFELMTENKRLAVEDMMHEYILPYLKKQMNHKDEIAAVLEDHQIQKLDSMYVPREAIRRYNERAKQQVFDSVDQLLKGGTPSPVDQFNPQQEQSQVKQDMAPLGNQRFLSPGDVTWKAALKNFEWSVDVQSGDEQTDKQEMYQTLSTVLQTLGSNPGILNDPNARLVFSKILSLTGAVSPIELSTAATQPQPQPGVPGSLPTNQLQAPQPTPSPLAELQTKK